MRRNPLAGSGVYPDVSMKVMTDRPSTLAELHHRQYAPMVRLATLLLASQAEAEEVVQDCFVRMFPRFDEVDEPGAYLRRAVVNACNSVGRRRQRERRHPPSAADAAELGADEMFDALATLPARQRAALVLRFYEDLSGPQIAEALGCRPGTVKALIHRGLAHLREVLGE
jgi:RNA polymerase sigma-70 factor (sigma-E family)